ncbi:MAG: glycoside hydrolase family 2 TIM barrel-domain containing protein [Clostridia bacterium]|nr:glycoside hydrolase family 2 TIM barrel-domain containing protein [Clostridia bacterium]
MREKILFDDGWKFHRGDLPKRATVMKGPDYIGAKTERMIVGPASWHYKDESDAFEADEVSAELWEDVDLPHDYVIEGVPDKMYPQALGYLKYENAWYRKHFSLGEEDKNRRITLYFEGVATHATVYLNGCLMKHNFCGYTPFEVDITDMVYFDKENILAVYTDSAEHEGWWYQGGGIYRHVWLVKTERVAVDLWGVFVNPKKTDDGWITEVETTLINSSVYDETVTVVSSVVDSDGNEIASANDMLYIGLKDKAVLEQRINVKAPALWDIDKPNMYTLITRVYRNSTEIDKTETRFGYRTFEFNCDKGFFLNGRQVKLKGVCAHQDYGITGKAVADNVYRYRIELIKEMGANAYRTSHYPHAEATMDALDENGILVMDETRWYESTDEGTAQLEALIRRDRNHPSVILWSIGNEEPMHLTEQGRRIAESLTAAVRRLDKSRPVTTAVSNDPINSTVMDTVDVIGVNYNLQQYDDIHKMYPNKPFVSSECCATGTTRGWYFDDSPKRSFMSAYDKDTTRWFLARENTWKFVSEREWVAGSFQWIAIEHRGECVWPRLCSQSGAIDMFLQKKDAFYQNQSHWTDNPMVHILPHWNHEGREGELIDVWVYTNCEEAELFLNGSSLGTRKIERYGHGAWRVPYEKGVLKAIGRNGGQEAASEEKRTSGKAAQLRLRADNRVEYANGRDLAIVTCYCVDENGIEVPDAEPFVKFDTNSLGTVVGTGSDISDHIPPSCPDRKMRAGLCAAAVRVGKERGTLKIYATAENLKSCVLSIELKQECK